VLLLAFLIGIVAGLRALTAPAVIAWGAAAGVIGVGGALLRFFAFPWTPWIVSALALAEFVTDQLPGTPSRTVPVQFGTRLISGALCGAALGYADAAAWSGAAAGVAGAVIGTLGGHAARARLARAFGRDRPAAFLEDAVAIGGSLLVVFAVP